MSTTIETFKTSFDQYVPCDKATYKKLKRIVHLFTQHVRPWANRWERSRNREEKNRYFVFNKKEHQHKKKTHMVTDSWVFAPLFNRDGDILTMTDLHRDLFADCWSARTPVANPEQVQPLKLSLAELDKLERELVAFIEQMRSYRQS